MSDNNFRRRVLHALERLDRPVRMAADVEAAADALRVALRDSDAPAPPDPLKGLRGPAEDNGRDPVEAILAVECPMHHAKRGRYCSTWLGPRRQMVGGGLWCSARIRAALGGRK